MSSKMPGSSEAIAAAAPLLGTWRLNLGKSDYRAVPWSPPRSITLTFLAPREGEARFTVDEVPASGPSIHIEWAGKYNGKDYPATGSIYFDSVAMKRASARTMDWTLKKGGQLAFTATSSVSQDDETLTMTFTGKDPQRETTTEVQVYDKELTP